MAKKKISDYVAEWLKPLEGPDGVELSRCEFVKEAGTWYLRVYIDKLENGEYVYVSSDDCETVSRYLSEKLDAEDPIEQNYYLEVSSPGLDRLLLTEKDFNRFMGQLIDIKLYKAMDGTKELHGTLTGYNDGEVTIVSNDKEIVVPKGAASKINLTVVF